MEDQLKLKEILYRQVTKGGTSAKVQASVPDLYDTSRQRFPMANGSAISWEQLDKQLGAAISGSSCITYRNRYFTNSKTDHQ